jgi:hypothetical protein
MKQRSVSEMKGHNCRPQNKLPREGSRLRRVYDRIAEHRGRVVELPWDEFDGRHHLVHESIAHLRNWYALDIRVDRRFKKDVRSSFACLAGEWDERGDYVDYIAEARQPGDAGEEDLP